MKTESKIGCLKDALLNGEVMSPQKAFERWNMQANTYHRSIYGLKNKHGLIIAGRILHNEKTGVEYSEHWIVP
jgi:hypothetical protein